MSVLIAIEGIDGSGKGTQTKRLHHALQNYGLRVFSDTFPKYNTTFHGQLVGEYLNGKFGTLEQVHPFLAAMLFAGDRKEYKAMLNAAMSAFDVVILDRYVLSNIGHQCARVEDEHERTRLQDRILRLEYDLNGMPRPDVQFLLDVPVEIAEGLVAGKKRRDYTTLGADIHEADRKYQARVRDVYRNMAVAVFDENGICEPRTLSSASLRPSQTRLYEIPCAHDQRWLLEEQDITERMLQVLMAFGLVCHYGPPATGK